MARGNLAATSAAFETQALCEAAGKKAEKDLEGVFTGVHYTCVQARNEAPASSGLRLVSPLEQDAVAGFDLGPKGCRFGEIEREDAAKRLDVFVR